ncbi:hypothetical protein TNCV_1159311 [Trichonephila clavipes]|nr:hypothetical protein TNCV_1159311 [Trichonephila clavipes]
MDAEFLFVVDNAHPHRAIIVTNAFNWRISPVWIGQHTHWFQSNRSCVICLADELQPVKPASHLPTGTSEGIA